MLLNSPLIINSRQLANRVVLHPMEGCDGEFDGSVGQLTQRRYLRFAESGAGLIWFEACAVGTECRANPRQLYLNERNADSYSRLIEKVKETAVSKFGYIPLIVLQSTNSGRWSKPNGYPEPLIAYHNSLWEIGREDLPYTVVSDEYCDQLAERYYESAKLAEKVGFDGVDIKCCHGYLFNEFLSAYSRSGRYGGDFDGRTRLYFSCIDAVKSAVSSNCIITSRLNACDTFPYGYGFGVDENNNIDLDETKQIIAILRQKGVGLLNITLGNPYLIPHINRPCTQSPESIQIGLDRIRSVTGELQKSFEDIAMVASGVSAASDCIEYGEELLKDGIAKLIGFGRMSFAYPTFWVDYLTNGRLDKRKCCVKCGKCTQLMRSGSVTGCPIHDRETYLPCYNKYVLRKE